MWQRGQGVGAAVFVGTGVDIVEHSVKIAIRTVKRLHRILEIMQQQLVVQVSGISQGAFVLLDVRPDSFFVSLREL